MKLQLFILITIALILSCNSSKNVIYPIYRYFSKPEMYTVLSSVQESTCFNDNDYVLLENTIDSIQKENLLHLDKRYLINKTCEGIWTYTWTSKVYALQLTSRTPILRYNDSVFLLKKIELSERIKLKNRFYNSYKYKVNKTEWFFIEQTILRGIYIKADSTALIR